MSEQEEEVPKILNADLIQKGLADTGRTADGSSFAFLRLDVENRHLESMNKDIESYPQLRFVNVSGNQFQHIEPLAKLPNLFKLEARSNRLMSLDLFCHEDTFSYLQYLDLSGNSLRTLGNIKLPKLLHLILTNNEIAGISDFEGHPTLKKLELRANKLVSMNGLKNMPALEELYLAENNITTIDGLEEMPVLKKLHLRKNNITTIDEEKLNELPELTYLNLRQNELTSLDNLKVLKKLKKLETLNVLDCPFEMPPDSDFRLETLLLLPALGQLNKETIESAEKEAAYAEAEERHRIAEEERRRAEEEAEKAAALEEEAD